jgi:hypothetical protein
MTDSGSNTAQGQSNVSVTNNSTQAQFTYFTAWIRNSDHKTIQIHFTTTANKGYQGSATTGWTVTVNSVSQGFTSSMASFATNGDNTNYGFITLTNAAPTGATVVVSYNAAVGNATDNGGIALESFTSPALPTSFPLTTSGATLIGSLNMPAGSGIQIYPNPNTQIWFTATGTSLSFVQQAFGTAWLTTVDGATSTVAASKAAKCTRTDSNISSRIPSTTVSSF